MKSKQVDCQSEVYLSRVEKTLENQLGTIQETLENLKTYPIKNWETNLHAMKSNTTTIASNIIGWKCQHLCYFCRKNLQEQSEGIDFCLNKTTKQLNKHQPNFALIKSWLQSLKGFVQVIIDESKCPVKVAKTK